jgi:hypothetical protein
MINRSVPFRYLLLEASQQQSRRIEASNALSTPDNAVLSTLCPLLSISGRRMLDGYSQPWNILGRNRRMPLRHTAAGRLLRSSKPTPFNRFF